MTLFTDALKKSVLTGNNIDKFYHSQKSTRKDWNKKAFESYKKFITNQINSLENNKKVALQANIEAANQELTSKVQNAVKTDLSRFQPVVIGDSIQLKFGKRNAISSTPDELNWKEHFGRRKAIKIQEKSIQLDVDKMPSYKAMKKNVGRLRANVNSKIEGSSAYRKAKKYEIETEKLSNGMAAYGGFVAIMSGIKTIQNAESFDDEFSGGYSVAGGIQAISDVQFKGTSISGAVKNQFKALGNKALQKQISLDYHRYVETMKSGQKSAKSVRGLADASESAGKTVKAARSGANAGKVASRMVPLAGVVLDSYFIAKDIEAIMKETDPDKKVLLGIHLAIDSIVLVLGVAELLFPPLAVIIRPVVLLLTALSMSIDTYYWSIKNEMDKADGGWEKAGAFFVGFSKAWLDVLTGGFLGEFQALVDRVEADNEMLQNIADPEKMFTITGETNEGKTIDFLSGEFSGYGGEITFTLHDDDSFTVKLGNREETFDAVPGGITEIVLGLGEKHNPEYTTETAHVFWFIPVKSYQVISDWRPDPGSRWGEYFGNSDANSFYAAQGDGYSCESLRNPTESSIKISQYTYKIYGKAGDDKFYLGPQSSSVDGGQGNDHYILGATAGNTVINNFANDLEEDVLSLNVSFSDLKCTQRDTDLVIEYCGIRAMFIKNWFVPNPSKFRHLTLIIQDGLKLEPRHIENEDTISCVPIAVDRSGDNTGQIIDSTSEEFGNVVLIKGSKYDDEIIGNDNANFLVGGEGDDKMTGGNGADTYIIGSSDGCDVIDNFAEDNVDDTLVFKAPYNDIELDYEGLSWSRGPYRTPYLFIRNSEDQYGHCCKLLNFMDDVNSQHLVVTSADKVTFSIAFDDDGIPSKDPQILNYAESDSPVYIDLKDASNPQMTIDLTEQEAATVVSVVDSKFNDVINGNEQANYLSCSGGIDELTGNEEQDKYVVRDGCQSVTINNYDEELSNDMLYIEQYYSSLRFSESGNDIEIAKYGTKLVTLKSWFESESYQHLVMKTKDGITVFFATNSSNGDPLSIPYEMERLRDSCNGEHKTIDISVEPWTQVQRVVGRSKTCSYSIIGNDEGNYIDPGIEEPFGYQYLEGGRGSDFYVIGKKYGLHNRINNYDENSSVDNLQLDVAFKDIRVCFQLMFIICAIVTKATIEVP